MLWLEKLIEANRNRTLHQLLDIQIIPNLSGNEVWAFEYCRINGENAGLIFAIADPEYDNYLDLLYIKRAWSMNIETEKIEEISVIGLSCKAQVGDG